MKEDNKQVRISILIPAFNVQDYLEECLESVLVQTLQPCEIVLAYEKSGDRTLEICESYAARHDMIKIVEQQAKGLSAARNTGLDHATGDFIVFIDSDDFISGNMLAVLHETITRTGADMVKCGIQLYFNESRTERMKGIQDSELVMENKETFFRAFFHKQLNPGVCNAIYRRELFHGIRFFEGKLVEDTFVAPHLLMASKKIVTIPEPLYCYRQREGSIMRTFDDRHFDILESKEQLKQVLLDNGLFESLQNDLYVWYGFHLMIMIKQSAKYSPWRQYKKYVSELHRREPEEELDRILQAVYNQDGTLQPERNYQAGIEKMKKALAYFRSHPDRYWLKVAYNQWKKSRKNI